MKKSILILSILSLFLTFTSCKTNDKSNSPESVTVDEDINTAGNTDVSNDLVIYNTYGNAIGGIDLNPMRISANGKKYSVKTKPEKKKFYANGKMQYEIKLKDKGFKLRDKNSDLLWKIKIYPDKYKVSDNEENQNAFVVRNYEDKIKIKRNDEEVYRIKLDSMLTANDKAIYKFSAPQNHYAYAVLAINEIPEDQRLFIIAELLKQL